MSLVYTPNLFERLNSGNILVDTCTIIDASNCDEVDDFLRKMSEEGCTFLSLPAVREEFTCSARSLEEYKQLMEYVDTLQILFLDSTEKKLVSDDNAKFNIVLSRCKNIHPSYVDRMLLAVPYLFRNSVEKIYLMSSNRKDIPSELFKLVGFISYADNEFHNIGIYEFNNDGFERKAKNIETLRI